MPPLSAMGITQLAPPPTTISFGLPTQSAVPFSQQQQPNMGNYSSGNSALNTGYQMTGNNQFGLPPQGLLNFVLTF